MRIRSTLLLVALCLLATSPEIVLLGTGATQRFPHPKLTAPLLRARVGLEVMDTRAACRTYNILVAEGRSVTAALIIEQAVPVR